MASTETREATRPRASDRAATARPPDRDTAPRTPGRDMALKPVVIDESLSLAATACRAPPWCAATKMMKATFLRWRQRSPSIRS